ncbi:UPF0729 protein C18orf32 homolog [Ascaphus truei]|uniref:UPF0729 protein C18orf32 homolog n=1 Tax=Ascaphus truei TaxID=8439 RepID=UPI003F5940DA
MVCIPCIVIPVLLWVYKKFLEPYVYPFIAPFINRIWPSKSVKEVPAPGGKEKVDCNGSCTPESNGITNGSVAKEPEPVSDKKTD